MPALMTVKGLVIRETPYRDADKLFDLLTENGIRTVQARSVRKAGSKYAAVTQLFSYGEFCLREDRGRYYLDSAVSLNMFYGVRNDLEGLALASYFSELLRMTATDQSQPQLLRLFLLALHHLSEHDRPAALVKSVFELRLITELGMMPDLVCCKVCMTYLPERLVLRIPEADMICTDCLPENTEAENIVGTAVLQAARHVVFSETDRLFQFRLKGASEAQFAQYTENYLLTQLKTEFRTLRFYHDLTGMHGKEVSAQE